MPAWLRRACRRLHIALLRARLAQLLNHAQGLAIAHDAEAPLRLGQTLDQITELRLQVAELEHAAALDRRVRAVLGRLP